MSSNDEILRPDSETQDEEENNALDRLVSFLKQRSTRISPRSAAGVSISTDGQSESMGDPDAPDAPDADFAAEDFQLPAGFRSNLLSLYRRRQGAAGRAFMSEALDDSMPAAVLAAPANNWIPRGPSVVRQGQALNRPAVSGRIAGVAVARGGERVYVASANGGVWRSDDGGTSWRSTMEAWDLDPTTESSDSLSCGAIVIDLEDPDRVYVGTGEGDNVFIQGGSVIGTGAYFGVGPIRSDDGGNNWHTEPLAPGSGTSGGSAFYALALDPGDRERVVGATIDGLYRREPDGNGGYHWVRKRTGIFTSVVAARDAGKTVFFAARWGGSVFFSTDDGNTWNTLGPGLPTGAGRVSLAVQTHNPSSVYCLLARYPDNTMLGVSRFDKGGTAWKTVSGWPTDLLGRQGWYDLAIAVDPDDVNLIYLGGASYNKLGNLYPACLYRCLVTGAATGGGYAMTYTYIGENVHADVHALHFTPGAGESLWVGCDGGLFYNSSARTSNQFVQRNVGLATLTVNEMGLHPTEEAVLFCGTQDNGTIRYTGEEVWLHSDLGDGGSAVVNWQDPYRVVRVFNKGNMYRTADGGQSDKSWNRNVSLPAAGQSNAEFYAPLVGTPRNPAAPAEAEMLAFGGDRPWLSYDFGDSWNSIPDDLPYDRLGFNILALCFASARRLYVGTNAASTTDENGEPVTVGGDVYVFNEAGGRWSRAAIAADPLPAAPVTSIAVDPADASGDSIYITLGGRGDYRHVWHYDGSRWEARSGPQAGSDDSLMDVQHNAIVCDTEHPGHLYVGADIGVWRSTDSGATWEPFVNGLPDAAVVDLKIFAPTRVLLAATYGRGVFERTLDSDTALATELYARDTQLDLRRAPSSYGADDPTRFGGKIGPGASPDIKVDTPSAAGDYQTQSSQINFFEFVDVLEDRGANVAALDSTVGVITHRVYVQVHNRGVVPADSVRVMLLLASAANGVPDLPDDYETSVNAGTPISTQAWTTVGIRLLNDVRVGLPKIASFDLPSNMLLPPQAGASSVDYALLALLSAPSDVYTNGERSVSVLSQTERKAAFKKIVVS